MHLAKKCTTLDILFVTVLDNRLVELSEILIPFETGNSAREKRSCGRHRENQTRKIEIYFPTIAERQKTPLTTLWSLFGIKLEKKFLEALFLSSRKKMGLAKAL